MSTKVIFKATNEIKSISKTESFRADATDFPHLSMSFIVIGQGEYYKSGREEHNGVCLNSKDAIELAKAILEHYQVNQ